ncbi:hypothetical protein IEO21_10518 [Rhodonia placenta]|uniref:FHA domain-containing protein n=1 Tax=Rhodonia placenta TaxID=104341 RepID=A0A8H7NS96_9APHY|nr:hypothetical protein IEO21_10518 [Postia placenta]
MSAQHIDDDAEPDDEDALTFGIFALRDLKAHEEVVLGWEWDDGSVIHHLPALINNPHIFPPHHLHQYRQQMMSTPHTLSSIFTTCSRGPMTRDCALALMVESVDSHTPPTLTPSPRYLLRGADVMWNIPTVARMASIAYDCRVNIFIKDVKSSNGTFINGKRLSPEGVESEPFELKSDDIVHPPHAAAQEFGIDIIGENNKTIIHHKVAARVVCVFTEQKAQAGPASYGVGAGGGAPPAAGAFSFAPGQPPNAPGQQRRPLLQQGLIGLGDRSGNMRAPGKSGLTFDHILSRLQGELQKSRDTGAELHSLTSAMNEIHDTLGGNLPPNLPPHPSNLPPVMPPQSQQQQQESEQQQPPAAPSSLESGLALSELQSQLHETQMSLASHVDKIRSLETMLAEHKAIKCEVGSLRELMEERKREMDTSRGRSGSPSGRHHQYGRDDNMAHDQHYMSDDDDDAHSVSTIVPHELDRVDEEDEEQEEEQRRRRRDELGRPRTPEPTGMGMSDDDYDHDHDHSRYEPQRRTRSPSPLPAALPVPIPAAVPDIISERLTTLLKQLESALELSRSLEAQHSVAQSTISLLESKVASLESLVHDTRSQVQVQTEATEQLAEAMCSEQLPDSAAQEAEQRTQESLMEMVNE